MVFLQDKNSKIDSSGWPDSRKLPVHHKVRGKRAIAQIKQEKYSLDLTKCVHKLAHNTQSINNGTGNITQKHLHNEWMKGI